jgi:hypothetical protein
VQQFHHLPGRLTSDDIAKVCPIARDLNDLPKLWPRYYSLIIALSWIAIGGDFVLAIRALHQHPYMSAFLVAVGSALVTMNIRIYLTRLANR